MSQTCRTLTQQLFVWMCVEMDEYIYLYCLNVRRLSSMLGLEENAARVRTHLPDQTVSSAEVN